jgi:hypothetical protein
VSNADKGAQEYRPGTFEFPEADAIAAQLDRARTAREKLDRTIAWLEEGLSLFAGDTPPSRPELPAAPARKPSTGPRSTERNIEAKIIHVVLKATGPLSRNEIAEQVGTSLAGVKNPLQRLVKAERIVAEGNTRNRVYRAAPHAPHSEHRARTQKGQERGAAQFDARRSTTTAASSSRRAWRSAPATSSWGSGTGSRWRSRCVAARRTTTTRCCRSRRSARTG